MTEKEAKLTAKRYERANAATGILEELAADIQHAIDVNDPLYVTAKDVRRIAKIARLIQELI